MKPRQLVALIFLVSFLGMIGSLYISYYGDPRNNMFLGDLRNPLRGIAPCALCRYTRICLFPLVFISWIALQYKDRHIRRTILPFGVVWLIVSVYIYGIEMDRWTKSSELCGINNTISCGDPAILYGGWFTLATAGIISFLAIIWACLRLRKHEK